MLSGLERALAVKEAIHSSAMEHPAACRCDVCKAAAGDTDALARVWVAVDEAPMRSPTSAPATGESTHRGDHDEQA